MKRFVSLFWIIGFFLSIVGCKKIESVEKQPIIELIAQYDIDVDEPSGLDLSNDNNTLWTVSDRKNKAYKLSLTGQVLKEIQISANDLEGISVDPEGNSIWLVSESSGEVIKIDTFGVELARKQIPGVRDGSGGLEGITINSVDKHVFLLKEKDPGAFIELTTDLETSNFKRLSSSHDYSGMYYNISDNDIWIVSDEMSQIYRCDISGTFYASYDISVDKAEGIAFDSEKKIIYIVCDSTDSLYVYQLNE